MFAHTIKKMIKNLKRNFQTQLRCFQEADNLFLLSSKYESSAQNLRRVIGLFLYFNFVGDFPTIVGTRNFFAQKIFSN